MAHRQDCQSVKGSSVSLGERGGRLQVRMCACLGSSKECA